MKRETTEITLQQYRALTTKKAGKPRAPREPATGLTTMLLAGWSVTFQPGRGYRLDKGALTSGWCEDERGAVLAARRAAVGDGT